MACCVASATAAFNKYAQCGMAWCRSHVLHGAATPAAEQTPTGQAPHRTVWSISLNHVPKVNWHFVAFTPVQVRLVHD